jgi:uncharacterized protein (TIGR00290 family)
MREKVVVGWSGGKDSALALYESARTHDVTALLTTVTDVYDRVSMHGVRTELLRRQAAALGHPLDLVTIPPACSNDEYEGRMRAALLRHRAVGVTTAVFGDIFLEDVRRYREERLLQGDFKGLFPLWGRDSRRLAGEFIDLGFRAVLCCVDTHVLDPSFAGRPYDADLLADLPSGADPCGENGEFHTFVFDGPLFARPVAFQHGSYTLRDGRFGYRDLLPVDSPRPVHVSRET